MYGDFGYCPSIQYWNKAARYWGPFDVKRGRLENMKYLLEGSTYHAGSANPNLTGRCQPLLYFRPELYLNNT